MRRTLLAASAVIALLGGRSAHAEEWPGFFRSVAQTAATEAWSGFYRGVLPAQLSVRASLEPASDAVASSAALFPDGARKPGQQRTPVHRIEEAEFAVTHTAEAASALAAATGSRGPGFLKLSAGYYDILQDDDTAGSISLEYHAGRQFWWFDPFAGLMVTTEGAAYAYAGVALDVVIADRIAITPSAAVGAYHDGGGKDLGHWVEFRTGAELAYIFNNEHRLGLAFYHLSNAGLGSDNPGTEILQVSYSLPLGGATRK